MANQYKKNNTTKAAAPGAKASVATAESTASVSVKKSAASSPSLAQSIEQKRAQHAMAKVLDVTSASASVQKKFKAYANSLPAMIQTTGLGQALAFAKVKANANAKTDEAAAWSAMYAALDQWLQGQEIWLKTADQNNTDSLAALVAGNQQQYQRAQAEAFAYLVWLKQFARALIAGEADHA